MKRVQAPHKIKEKPARAVAVSLENANIEVKEQMRKLGKHELRDDQRIAHYKTDSADWQVVVDLDIFEMMENFQGRLFMMSKNKTVILDNDSLHILVMGRARGQEAIDHLQLAILKIVVSKIAEMVSH